LKGDTLTLPIKARKFRLLGVKQLSP